jgi:hypothetical protein
VDSHPAVLYEPGQPGCSILSQDMSLNPLGDVSSCPTLKTEVKRLLANFILSLAVLTFLVAAIISLATIAAMCGECRASMAVTPVPPPLPLEGVVVIGPEPPKVAENGR